MIGATPRAPRSPRRRARASGRRSRKRRGAAAQNADALTLSSAILGTSASSAPSSAPSAARGGDLLFEVAAAAARESERLGMY